MAVRLVIEPPEQSHYCPGDFPTLDYSDKSYAYNTIVQCGGCGRWWFVGLGEYSPEYKKVRWYHYNLQARIKESLA